MRRASRAIPFAWLAVSGGCLAAGACLDPPLLPHPEAAAGEPGEGGRMAGQGGQEASDPDAGETGTMQGGAGAATSSSGAAGVGSGGVAGLAGGGTSAATAGSGAGSGGAPPRVTWLALEGNRAPGSEAVNDELGIEGSFYAYADACVSPSLSWDESTRCVTGTLCDAGPDFENWGVAIGFDFNNTGSSGEPPDTKLLWDPRDVSAQGLAWSVSGSAPGLQVWVLNMDPVFGGQCSADTCEIAGPPDGVASAPLSGELLFSRMQKDHWGGVVVHYEFNPALVHALQFKLPAINVGAQPFSFCVEALGVIR